MERFNELYEENKKLDKMFDDLYDISSRDIIEKNIIELLVEYGELANETRCFKYWSNKGSSEKEVVLEEFADCFIMVLCFCNFKDIDLCEDFPSVLESDIINQFKTLYNMTSSLDYNLDSNTIKNIFSNLINLGYLLGFNDQDIIDGCYKKINKNKIRFKTGF